MHPYGSGMPQGGAPYPPANNSSVPFGAGRWAPPGSNPYPALQEQTQNPSAPPFGAGRWVQPNQSPYPTSQPSPYPSSNAYPPQTAQAPYPTHSPYGQPAPYQSSTPYPPQGASASPYPPQNTAASPYPPQNAAASPYPPQNTTASPYPPSQGAYPPTSSPYHTSQPAPYPGTGGGAPYPGGSYYSSQQQSAYSASSVGSPYPPQSHDNNHYAHAGQQNSTHPSGSRYNSAAANSMAQCFKEMKSSGPILNNQPPKKGNPTVFAAADFDPVKDAHALRKAMRGFGTDEDTLINVICRRSNLQRQEIQRQYKTHFGKDLIEDIKSETSGNFQRLLVGLLLPIVNFYVKELNDAMEGIGTDEDVLIEVLCTLSNQEIYIIKTTYERTYGRPLEAELMSETSGNFKRLLVSLCCAARDESGVVDPVAAQQDARDLLNAGELRFGTDESTFNRILCQRNFQHLQAVFTEYANITGHTLDKAIKREFSGDIEEGLLSIYQIVTNKAEFFARRLHKSMAGLGTNDSQLIRLVITRCEIDMADIKQAFEGLYGKSLKSWIKGDTSGHYKHALYALIGEERSG